MKEKIAMALERLCAFMPPEGYYLAFSGGKDSMVLYHLAVESGVKFDAHMMLTGVDPPELLRFVIKNYPKVILHKPEKSMWRLIREHMILPLCRTRFCCENLKEKGGSGRFVLTGIRSQESAARAKRRMVESCLKDSARRYLNPIIDWTTQDVWQFIQYRNLPYCCLYDEGFARIGCIGCPNAGKQVLKHFERWPGYKRMYLAAAAAVVERKKKNPKLVQYADGQALFDRWLSLVIGTGKKRKTARKDANQIFIHFED